MSIAEMETFFESFDIATANVQLEPHIIIVDVAKFIDSHFEVLNHCDKKSRSYQCCYYRLSKFIQLNK